MVPCLSGTFGSVRASMKNSLPTGALAMKHFSPLRIHSSPLRSARSLRPALGSSWRHAVVGAGARLGDALAEHEGVVGDERPAGSAPSARRCRLAEIRWLHFQFWLKALEIALSALASSVITSACVTKSVPWPPHSFGTARVRKPSLEPFLMMSQSQVSRAVVDRVARERERADLLVGEFARRHLPGALFVAQRKVHGSILT